MNIEDCIQLGYIPKAHGLKGELKAVFDVQNIEDYGVNTRVYVQKKGEKKLIPFRLEKVHRGGKQIVIRFEDVWDRETAESFIGSSMWYPIEDLPELEDGHFYYFEIVGFEVQDNKLGKLGTVKDFFEAGSNDVMVMDYKGKEVLIPMNDNIVIKADFENKSVQTDLPEGLLELYVDA